jgi:hypothetical protein
MSLPPIFITLLAIAGGFALSFLGVGILWAGTPWPIQWLLFLPFFFLTFMLTRLSIAGKPAWLVVCGAAPLAGVITLFRDNNDSHLMPILTVFCWAMGVWAGYYLGQRFSPKNR